MIGAGLPHGVQIWDTWSIFLAILAYAIFMLGILYYISPLNQKRKRRGDK